MSLCVIAALTSCICTTVYCCTYMLINHRSGNQIENENIQNRTSAKINNCVLHKDDIILYNGHFWSIKDICEEQLCLKSIVCDSSIFIGNGWQEVLLNNGFEVIKNIS